MRPLLLEERTLGLFYKAAMHRTIKPRPHHLRYAARIVARTDHPPASPLAGHCPANACGSAINYKANRRMGWGGHATRFWKNQRLD